jgi:hypothetical protein
VADEYMQEGSYFNIFKKYHFFPKAWQYQRKCMPCEGTGKQDGKDCPRCLGSGLAPDWKVSETVLVPTPIDKDQPTLAPGAGYVTPDIDGWQAMKESLEGLEELMFKTMWGTEMETDGTNETATGRFIDTQPVNERLNKYADAAEVVEEYIINMIGKILFNGYDGCDVHYGRRFLIENPDEIWNKYLDARVKGAPISTLDELLKEYYIYKYANDSWELQRYLKLMAVEPFVHYTATQVLSLRVSETDYLKKIYFNEWLTTLQVNDIVLRSLDDLRASLEEYALTKELMRVSKNSISL